jgi:hypothetical protein
MPEHIGPLWGRVPTKKSYLPDLAFKILRVTLIFVFGNAINHFEFSLDAVLRDHT